MRKLVTIIILALTIVILITQGSLQRMDTFEFIRVLVAGTVVMIPLVALMFFAIKHAGMPLLRDFIEGTTFERILIIVILISLFYVKFIV